jgi:membrane protein YdbS with pleckstrin-like domain
LLVLDAPEPLVPPSIVADNLVTPGVWGFAITFAVVVVVVLLIIDMVRRVRRVRYRAEANERLDAEEAAATNPTD